MSRTFNEQLTEHIPKVPPEAWEEAAARILALLVVVGEEGKR